MPRPTIWWRAVAGAVLLLTLVILPGALRAQMADSAPATTEDRVAGKGWWPTKTPSAGGAFAGDAACAKCHASIAAAQVGNAMTRAAFRGAGGADAPKPAGGRFQSGPYVYTIVPTDGGYALDMRSGDQSLRSMIEWTFGLGRHGQTYLLQEGGSLYEAQVSSFATGELGLTPGHAEPSAGTIQHALGNKLTPMEATRCFSCHTTDWSNGSQLDIAKAIPGVHCEACHGPGADHAAAATASHSGPEGRPILNPASLSPAASIDYCGACHRTSMDVILGGVPAGVSSIRFQPYRLEKSRCWNKTGDARLTCVGCHNPHEPLVHEAAFYDAKCLSCHQAQAPGTQPSAAKHPAAKVLVCPKSRSNCTSCHMPKYNVPEMHSEFTDHFIRIAREGEPFPR